MFREAGIAWIRGKKRISPACQEFRIYGMQYLQRSVPPHPPPPPPIELQGFIGNRLLWGTWTRNQRTAIHILGKHSLAALDVEINCFGFLTNPEKGLGHPSVLVHCAGGIQCQASSRTIHLLAALPTGNQLFPTR